jgi:hypothetical protein
MLSTPCTGLDIGPQFITSVFRFLSLSGNQSHPQCRSAPDELTSEAVDDVESGKDELESSDVDGTMDEFVTSQR